MALIFERFQTPGIAELSYLIGDDSSGVAAVFDPTPDVEKYVEKAQEHRLAITHIFETHIHADLVSGSRELCERVGTAKIFLSHEGDARYGFDNEALADGDKFTIGDTVITVKHTPGHTPEHVSYLLAEKDRQNAPWGVLTGDSLFVGSAGRPDLLGDDESCKLAEQQFHTLRDFYLQLADGVTIFPAHGHGSPCGADISDRMQSTIGHERRFNDFLQFQDVESFTQHALESAPPVPAYYPRMKKLNAKGPTIIGHLPQVRSLPAKAFKEELDERRNVLIDTRPMLGFGGGHIRGALNIGREPMLTIWAGWLLDPEDSILLVLDADTDICEVVTLFLRSGYTKFA
ncbi:MAG: MBL fold metallo-hydrolase, partial [Verrucomicrobiaceae bacterium]